MPAPALLRGGVASFVATVMIRRPLMQRHGVDPRVPSICWPYGASVLSGRAQEHLAANSLHSAAKRMHISSYF